MSSQIWSKRNLTDEEVTAILQQSSDDEIQKDNLGEECNFDDDDSDQDYNPVDSESTQSELDESEQEVDNAEISLARQQQICKRSRELIVILAPAGTE